VIIHLLSAIVIPHERGAILAHSAHGREFMGAYDALSGVIVIAALLVGVLYSAGALHGERRDRSILFWKSLPVSDAAAVLSKAAVPILLLPVIIFVLVAAASAAMVTLQTVVWVVQGYDPRALWARLDLPFLWLSLAYGLPFMALWYAPIYAWLLFVSSWAPRWPFLWAAAPLVAVLMVEHGALHDTSAHWMVERWLGGGVLQPYSVGGAGAVWIHRLADLDPARIYTLPQLWLGLAAAALLLAGAVRMRRTRGAL
jgi:ABC-2 type transport system permease protein